MGEYNRCRLVEEKDACERKAEADLPLHNPIELRIYTEQNTPGRQRTDQKLSICFGPDQGGIIGFLWDRQEGDWKIVSYDIVQQ